VLEPVTKGAPLTPEDRRLEQEAMATLLKVGSHVRGGFQHWLKGAPTHVLADLLGALSAEGWVLRRRGFPDGDVLHRQIVGGLRSAVAAHGPITAEHIESAAKRCVAQVNGLIRDPSWSGPRLLSVFLDGWEALGQEDRERVANYVWGELSTDEAPHWRDVHAAMQRAMPELREAIARGG
jgi:hypothetical protein